MKKKLSKKLTLNRETIRALSEAQLDKPAGGAPTVGVPCNPVSEYSCYRTCTC